MTTLTWTEILEQVGKQRYKGKRYTHFGKLKEQLDIKKQRKKNMEKLFEIQESRRIRVEDSRTVRQEPSEEIPRTNHKLPTDSDPFTDDYIKRVYKNIRKDRTTIKDSHWLRPDNN